MGVGTVDRTDQSSPSSLHLELAKADLHRHLSGSIRFTTLFELAQASQVDIGASTASELEMMMSVRSPIASLDEFISPRKTLRPWDLVHKLISSPEVAARLAFEAAEDAASDGVTYVELRISPYGVINGSDLSLDSFLNGLISGLDAASKQFDTRGVIVLSLPRHRLLELTPAERNKYYTQLLTVCEPLRGGYLAGFDLAGTENQTPPQLFADFFQEAKNLGFGVTIHAGEGESPKNIEVAIDVLGADRIGHGVTLCQNQKLIDRIIEQNITIEQSLTSNFMTSVVKSIDSHPLPHLLQAGVKVVLCTDNPVLFGVSLSDEYNLAATHFGITDEQLILMNRWAHSAAFITSTCC